MPSEAKYLKCNVKPLHRHSALNLWSTVKMQMFKLTNQNCFCQWNWEIGHAKEL